LAQADCPGQKARRPEGQKARRPEGQKARRPEEEIMKKTSIVAALTAGVGIACAVSCSSVQKKNTVATRNEENRTLASTLDAGLVGPDGEVYLFFKNDNNEIVIKQCERYTTLHDGSQRQDCKSKDGAEPTKVSVEKFKRSLKAALEFRCQHDDQGFDKDHPNDQRERHCDIGDDKDAQAELQRILDFVNQYGYQNAEPGIQEKIRRLTEVTKANKLIDHLVDDIISQRKLTQIIYSDDKCTFEFNILRAFVKNPGLSADFTHISAGTFLMGSPNDVPDHQRDEKQHEVTISKNFEIQTTVVTQAQYFLLTGYNPSYFKDHDKCPEEHIDVHGTPLCPNHPVEQVSWQEAQDFIGRLNAADSEFYYRLPTEAELEYVIRAGTRTPYWWGEAGAAPQYAWDSDNSNGQTHPVGTKPANPWGLYDASGNVWQWAQDWYGDYSNSQVTDPAGPSSGSGRVLRGGSWGNPAPYLRSAGRYSGAPGFRGSYLGFRLVRTRK
jgi:formylglycine-generating enzyme required for sulfatase activity